MRCPEVQEMIPAFVGGSDASLSYRRHLARCADCSHELGRYEQLVGDLARMRTAYVDPPARLLGALVAIPSRRDRRAIVAAHLARNRKAYAGGIALALVGVAGAAWRTRSRGVATA